MGLLQNRTIIPSQENYSIIDNQEELGGIVLLPKSFFTRLSPLPGLWRRSFFTFLILGV